MSLIHPSAVIGPNVKLGKDVEVGPFVVIKGDTVIGDFCKLESHVSVGSDYGVVKIGSHNHIFQGAVVGSAPQDLKYNNEPTELIMGDHNTIREFATINIGTTKTDGVTKIGSHNLLMAYVHVAHDCIIDDYVVISNSTQLAGHVEIDDHVTIGGCCAVSQFCRLGRFAYIGGDSTINKDVLPFSIAEGKWAVMRATNKVGLERNGFSKADVEGIHKSLRNLIKGSRTIDESIQKIKEEVEQTDHIKLMLNFIENSKKGLAK